MFPFAVSAPPHAFFAVRWPKPCTHTHDHSATLLPSRSASSRAQRASARNMTGSASASAPLSDPLAPAETVASTSTLTADPDPASMQVDSDDASLSRSNSVQLGEEGEEISSVRRSSLRRDLKGKGKERATQVKIKDEPTTVSLSLHDTSFSNQTVRASISTSAGALFRFRAVQRRPLFCVSLSRRSSVLRRVSSCLPSLVCKSADGCKRRPGRR